MATNADYRRAQKDESYRQAFLDSIDLEDAKPYVKRVVYVPRQKYNIINADIFYPVSMEVIRPLLTKFYVRGFRPKIKVYPVSFSDKVHPRLDDFLGTLIDHEGQHSKENYLNPCIIVSSPLHQIICESSEILVRRIKKEIRAEENQIRSVLLGKRQVSPSYLNGIIANLKRYRNVLNQGLRRHS